MSVKNANDQTIDQSNVSEMSSAFTSPLIVVEMGKISSKKIKALKKGKGKLMGEVKEAVRIASEHTTSQDESNTNTVQPIVLVYEKKKKQKKWF